MPRKPSAATISAVQRYNVSQRWKKYRQDEAARRITELKERGELDEPTRERLLKLLVPAQAGKR